MLLRGQRCRPSLFFLVLVALVTVGNSVCAISKDAAKSPDSDVATLQKVADEFALVFNAGDAKRIAGFYSEEVIYMIPHIPNRVGRATVEQDYEELFAKYTMHVDVHIEEAKIFGDMAFDRATYRTTRTPKAGGETVVINGRLLEILRKEDGRWKSFRVVAITD